MCLRRNRNAQYFIEIQLENIPLLTGVLVPLRQFHDGAEYVEVCGDSGQEQATLAASMLNFLTHELYSEKKQIHNKLEEIINFSFHLF